MDSDSDSNVGYRLPEVTEIEQIVHDLNNQVMVIQGNASLLKMKASEGSEIGELAEQILSASQRAASLTKQLTDRTSHPVGGARQG